MARTWLATTTLRVECRALVRARDGGYFRSGGPRVGTCTACLREAHMYAELHALSHFSFLRGASGPDELVEQACSLGYRALAITDECSLAGVVRAHLAAKQHGLPLIIGAEFTCIGDLKLVVLATAFKRGIAAATWRGRSVVARALPRPSVDRRGTADRRLR